MSYRIKELPNIGEVETKTVLKKSLQANKALAELKGILATIPDQNILINTLSLQEAKDSSAIENVITTHDELFKASLDLQVSAAAKEVQSYAAALKRGHDLVQQYGFLSTKHLLQILDILEPTNGAIRRLPGTVLKNQQTGEVVYMPPQDYDEIVRMMSNLEQFINNDELADWDADVPVLYLSRYVVRYKGQYYQKLQAVRDHDDWEGWICFMLEAVENTALYTIDLIKAIRVLMEETKVWCQESHPKIYSRELLDNLFKHPYTKIEFVMQDCQVTRLTAAKYLEIFAENNLLTKVKLGKTNYFINQRLIKLLMQQ